MRAPVPFSSWLKLTSLLLVAPTSFTGTWTRPKLIAPVQMALGIGSHPTYGRGTGRPRGARPAPRRVSVEVDGRELSLSNLDKLLYPAAGFRKADVIDYYRRIAPVMLPHLAGRPPTLVRAPDGAQGERFFEKRCPPHHPRWVPRVGPARAQRRAAELHRRRPPHAGVARQPRHARAPHEPVAAPRREPAPRGGARPRSGAPADVLDCCRVAIRRCAIAGRARADRGREDVGRQRPARSVPLNGGAP